MDEQYRVREDRISIQVTNSWIKKWINWVIYHTTHTWAHFVKIMHSCGLLIPLLWRSPQPGYWLRGQFLLAVLQLTMLLSADFFLAVLLPPIVYLLEEFMCHVCLAILENSTGCSADICLVPPFFPQSLLYPLDQHKLACKLVLLTN